MPSAKAAIPHTRQSAARLGWLGELCTGLWTPDMPRVQRTLLLAGVLAALILTVVLGFGEQKSPAHDPSERPASLAVPAATGPAIVEPQAFKPFSEWDAVAINASRPLDKRRIEIAFPFILPISNQDALSWERAVHCLALANYYEAAGEGDTGMRAVSQVVLNRMRHPAFPHSVCAVVFQGAERATGCQFTFTCDGSLAHPPAQGLFARARAIAIAALGGRVEPSVGMATHYHADFVVPYWADNLDKIRTLGRHIFYVWRGGWGNRSAFRLSHADEPAGMALPYFNLPVLPITAVATSETAPLASAFARINLKQASMGNGTGNRTFLAADEPAGTLKVDEDGNAGTIRAQPVLARSGEKVLNDDR